MAESVVETTNFSQDLFSPLQFCEVVEEGQQHRRQMQHLQSQHSPLNSQQITTLQPVNQNPHQLDAQSHMQSSNQAVIESNKTEVSQRSVQTSQILNMANTKSPTLFSTMEIYLPIHLQTVTSPLISLHQPHLTQPVYEVQLSKHSQQEQQDHTLQPLQLSPVHISSQSQSTSIQIPDQCQVQQGNSIQSSTDTTIDIENLANATVSFTSPVTVVSPVKVVNTVATQSTQTEDDEPEVIFTRVSVPDSSTIKSTRGPSIADTSEIKNKSSDISNETKPIPVKRTWRRPWKKKKEREKRQPTKKARRTKIRRKKFVPYKRHIVHIIDPRHGPPIDTNKTVVERTALTSINQMKQKRQRIKLNRNSGREYVNRLGKVVKARKIGSPCNCPLRCWERMGSKIVDIFNNFWDLCDFNLQNSYLFTCLKLCDVKRRYTKRPAEESRRQNTFEYFVRISGKHIKVCKKAFMSSHGLTSDKRLRTLFTQMKDGALIPELDKRGKHLRALKAQNSLPSNTNQNNNSNNHSSVLTPLSQHNSYVSNTQSPLISNHQKPASIQSTKTKTKSSKRKSQQSVNVNRLDTHKQTAIYNPHSHPPVPHIHSHCPPSTTHHHMSMQEPPHSYIPNSDIYFPGHYLDPHQGMVNTHMNSIAPQCQKMLEGPAYFMAGVKENTFHQ